MLIGSLFSGIGGLELGLEMASVGRTIWQVECDEFCRRVLERHWPDVERFEDVKKVGSHNLQTVDLICGGFPCQDVSGAGKGAGLAGSRSGLWFEFARILEELRPSWVVVENVASGAHLWVDDVVSRLEQLNYQALPIPLSAQDVGAPHLRRRIFVVAYTNRESQSVESEHAQMERMQESARCYWSEFKAPKPALCRMDDGHAAWVDRNKRLKALGNSVVPQCAEVIGHVILELERRLRGPL